VSTKGVLERQRSVPKSPCFCGNGMLSRGFHPSSDRDGRSGSCCRGPLARWCGRGRRVIAAPMPIKVPFGTAADRSKRVWDRFRTGFGSTLWPPKAAFCIVFTPLSTSEINTKIGPSAIIHAGALAVLKGGGRAVRVRGKDRCYYLFGLMQSVAVMPQIKIVAKNPFLTWPTDVCLRHREHQ
jgi:hypothetical protein